MKKLAALFAAAAVAVTVAAPGHAARAQYGTPYWQVHTVIDTLLSQGLDWNGGTANVRYIWCQGIGHWRYSYLDHAYLYSQFRCYVTTDTTRPMWIQVDTDWWWQWDWHVTSYA